MNTVIRAILRMLKQIEISLKSIKGVITETILIGRAIIFPVVAHA